MNLKQILDVLSRERGFDPLKVDPDGSCAFRCDDIDLVLIPSADGADVLLEAVLSDESASSRPDLLRLALEANADDGNAGGAVFAKDPETGRLTLEKCIPLKDATAEAFADALEDFIGAAEDWKILFGAVSAPADPEDEAGQWQEDGDAAQVRPQGWLAV